MDASSSASPEPPQVRSCGADIVGRHRGLGRRTLLISGLTLLSRILGFVREMLSAALFGDNSGIFDAFITAWRVPNLFRRFLGEGALSTSLQTAMTEVDGDRGDEAGRRLFLSTLGLLFWILVATTAIGMAVAWWIPGLLPVNEEVWLGRDSLAVRELTVRLLPFVVLICLSAAIGGALHVRGNFAAPAWAPIVFNAVWIGSLVYIGVSFGWQVEGSDHLAMARWLALGVLVAGVVQLAVQVPALYQTGLLVRKTEVEGQVSGEGSGRSPEARLSARGEDRPCAGALGVLKRSAPLALGAAVYQINVMIDGLMAEGLLSNGGPTLHYYANRLQQFPMALIAIAATSAVFPALKALGHRGQRKELREMHDRTQLAISFVALPASLALFALATPVVSAVFERGAFSSLGVERTAAALRALSLAILPAGAVGLVARTYYAVGDFSTPVRTSIVALVANICLNWLFIRGFELDVEGLGWATALTSWGQLALLLPGLRNKGLLPASEVHWWPRLLQHGVCAALCAGASYGVHVSLLLRVPPVLGLGTAIVAGLLVFAVSSELLRVPEWRGAKARVIGIGKGQ